MLKLPVDLHQLLQLAEMAPQAELPAGCFYAGHATRHEGLKRTFAEPLPPDFQKRYQSTDLLLDAIDNECVTARRGGGRYFVDLEGVYFKGADGPNYFVSFEILPN